MPNAPLVIPWANPRFVTYREAGDDAGGRPLTAHIVTPPWMLKANGEPDPTRCLFIVHKFTICGKCRDATASRSYTAHATHGYGDAEYYDALPAGYVLCTGCAARIRREFMPFMEGNNAGND